MSMAWGYTQVHTYTIHYGTFTQMVGVYSPSKNIEKNGKWEGMNSPLLSSLEDEEDEQDEGFEGLQGFRDYGARQRGLQLGKRVIKLCKNKDI